MRASMRGFDPKRTNAYSKALASIRALQVEVTSGAKIAKSGSDKVPNVGPSIGAQIDYFLANGVFERHAAVLKRSTSTVVSARPRADRKSSRLRTVTT